MLRAKAAEDPESILWANLGEPKVSMALRRALSYLLTAFLWIACKSEESNSLIKYFQILAAAILVASTYYKDALKKDYPTIDCADRNPTKSDVFTIIT